MLCQSILCVGKSLGKNEDVALQSVMRRKRINGREVDGSSAGKLVKILPARRCFPLTAPFRPPEADRLLNGSGNYFALPIHILKITFGDASATAPSKYAIICLAVPCHSLWEATLGCGIGVH